MKRVLAVLCVLGITLTGIGYATGISGSEKAQQSASGHQAQGANSPSPGSDNLSAPQVSQGTAVVVIDADSAASSAGYTSENSDENALRATGDVTALLDDITVEKSGGTEGLESCNVYGQNAGFLATDGASVTIASARVHTDGSGASGVFSYGENTMVTISDSAVSTEQDHSGGLTVSGGGTLNATDITVDTQGESSAAIRANRGGGMLMANGGAYTSSGTDSPAIYATSAIAVSGATLSANASAAVVVDGANSVTLQDCDVTGNMQNTLNQGEADNLYAVLLCRSTSGDAGGERGIYTMSGGSLTAKAGDLFYVTNTQCAITLNGVALTLANRQLLTVAGNTSPSEWGSRENSGGDCVFTADAQALTGTITVDTASVLALTLQNGASFTGTINPNGQAGSVSVTMDESSAWTLTADAYVTSFSGDLAQVNQNGHTLYFS